MKHINRGRESIKSMGILIICLSIIFCINFVIDRSEAECQSEEKPIQESVVPNVVEEENFEFNIDELIALKGTKVQDEAAISALVCLLPEGEKIKEIKSDKNKPHALNIVYDDTQNEMGLTKARKDQLILANGILLLNLCSEVDAINISIRSSNIKGNVSHLIYRLDVDKYLGYDIREVASKIEYEELISKLLDVQNINTFWENSYTYKSQLGEQVDNFFKLNFPIDLLEDGKMIPYIDEELGEDLVSQYGDKLFLEGLLYDNDLIKYYSAYRLIEFYESSNLEEILIGLAICNNKTENVKVKTACDYAIMVLSTSKLEEAPWLISRFLECETKGGQKVYKLQEGKLSLWCKWKDNMNGGIGIEVNETSGEFAYCQVHTLDKEYSYVLPVNEDKTYVLDPLGAKELGTETLVYEELQEKISRLMIEKWPDQKLEDMAMTVSWYNDELLLINLDESEGNAGTIHFLYCPLTQLVEVMSSQDQNYGETQLLEVLRKTYHIKEDKAHMIFNLRSEGNVYSIGNQYITIYEYKNMPTRCVETYEIQKLINAKQLSQANSAISLFGHGRLLVIYEGNNSKMLNILTKQLGEEIDLNKILHC